MIPVRGYCANTGMEPRRGHYVTGGAETRGEDWIPVRVQSAPWKYNGLFLSAHYNNELVHHPQGRDGGGQQRWESRDEWEG